MCVGLVKLEVVPSPKSQVYNEVFNDKFVKVITLLSSHAFNKLALKLAIGSGTTVILANAVSFCPLLLVTIKVAVYVPAIKYTVDGLAMVEVFELPKFQA